MHLVHKGIRGMKWGIRKNRHYSKDYTRTRKLRKKNSKYLSNIQLQQLNKRMQLEQQYNNLSTKSMNRGWNYLRTVGAAAATIGTIYAISNAPYIDKGKYLVKGMINHYRNRRK